MVTHRKVHLFDIDIPGKITFKVSCIRCFVTAYLSLPAQESETLTAGSTTNFFDTGKRQSHLFPPVPSSRSN